MRRGLNFTDLRDFAVKFTLFSTNFLISKKFKLKFIDKRSFFAYNTTSFKTFRISSAVE